MATIDALESYSKEFRELIENRLFSSKKNTKELLGLTNDSDWDFIWVSMDIVGDSNEAIP